MYTYTYISIYVYLYVCMYTCIYMYIHVYMCTRISYIYMYIYINIYGYGYIQIYIPVYIYRKMCIHLHTTRVFGLHSIHAHTNTHTHTLTHTHQHTKDIELLCDFIAVDFAVVFAVQSLEHTLDTLQLCSIQAFALLRRCVRANVRCSDKKGVDSNMAPHHALTRIHARHRAQPDMPTRKHANTQTTRETALQSLPVC